MQLLRNILVGASVLALSGMVLLIMLEIVLRAGFSTSTFFADEFVGYGLALITFVPLAVFFADGAMLRAGILRLDPQRLPARIVEVFNLVVLAGVVAFTCYAFYDLALRNYSRGTISQTFAATPLWMPMSLAVLGFAALLLAILVRLVRTLGGAEAPDAERSSPMNIE